MKYINWVWVAVLAAAMVSSANAETVILKSGATISGQILQRNQNRTIVDLGYTVLAIPADQILSIETDSDVAVQSDSPPAGQAHRYLYRTADLKPRSLQQCYEMVAEAVVMVSRPGGQGSGFFINELGYLITNYHVIEQETRIAVTLFKSVKNGFEKKHFKKVRIVALNPFLDLALLQVENMGEEKVPFVHLGDMDQVRVGQNVFVVGNPMGLERTLTEGAVSTVSRPFEGLVYIQTNADINPGNSGGPLFNMSGEVVGVTNMGYIFRGGLGFAIPADTVRYFVEHYDAFAYDKENPNTGYRYVQPDKRKNKNKPDLNPIDKS
ncbi:MAG: trypsin-like peptidase domain-containing protein [Sedimentisphaerales bacterium]|nr:trypsin-like peptidase domain-containing protein [Sedimentisphaerales bacterium]